MTVSRLHMDLDAVWTCRDSGRPQGPRLCPWASLMAGGPDNCTRFKEQGWLPNLRLLKTF